MITVIILVFSEVKTMDAACFHDNFGKMLKQYFIFTRKEKVGLFTLLLLIAIAQVIKHLIPYLVKEKRYDIDVLRNKIASLKVRQPDSSRYYSGIYNGKAYAKTYSKDFSFRKYDPMAGEVFRFDPNTLNAEGWVKLGIREKTIASIMKYLSKGGRFRKPEDIKKIWGIPPYLADKLIPYVDIVAVETSYANNKYKPFEKKTFPPKEKITVNINSGDSADYEKLPGIGPKLAARIINFRNRLGGFISVEQVKETFGLPDTTFQKIRQSLNFSDATVKQLDLNQATVEELKSHPYIRWHIANAIVEYRKQHGAYKNVEDLKKIMIVTDSIYKKVQPYLKL